MSELLEELRKRIEFISSDSWENRDAPVVRLNEDACAEGDGNALKGRLEVLVPRRDGEMVLFETRPLDGISSEIEIDDLLADILSVVLSKHDKWPR